MRQTGPTLKAAIKIETIRSAHTAWFISSPTTLAAYPYSYWYWS